jgi:hypothetical protein
VFGGISYIQAVQGWPIPVAQVYGRSVAGVAASNPARVMDVCCVYMLCCLV